MRILAIDVGVGTQDILLYDDSKNPENSIKLVMPAMTQILAKRIRESENDLFFYGETMGGGPLAFATSQHIKKGYKVLMTQNAARSIRDDLKEVESIGVKITEEGHGYERMETKDVDFELLFKFFSALGEEPNFDCVGIAVQDHGHGANKSDRIFRFEKFREILEKGAKLHEFVFEKPPRYYTRMNAVLRTARRFYNGRIFIADTKIAAIAGALHGISERPIISIDVGNGHTMVAAVAKKNEMLGIFEHHTWLLNRRKLEKLILKFAEGKLTNEEVFKDEGHGCYVKKKIGIKNVKRILVTGPNRRLLENSKLGVEFANPIGDVMMTGCIGLVDIIKSKK